MSVIHTAMSGIVVGGTRLRRDSGFADIATVLPEADIGQFSRCSNGAVHRSQEIRLRWVNGALAMPKLIS
jgi:hypothetical protein